MIQHTIALLFQINEITPIKAAWLAITVANVVMMLWLSRVVIDENQRSFSRYLILLAMVSLVQGSWVWNIASEVMLAVYSTIWVWTLLPKHTYGRIFALSIGLVVTCVLMLAVPPPWRGYDPAMYATRLYSTAAFLGVALGSSLMTRKPSTMLAVPWFMAVLIAGSQRGWDRWMVGIYTNLIWSGCLICWLAISRHRADGRVVSSTHDAHSAHPQYPQYPSGTDIEP